MANMCSNVAKINFKKEITSADFEAFKEYFYDNIIYEMCEFDYLDEEPYTMCEITYGTAWNSRTDALQELADLFDCNIVGVSWEFSNDYVDNFEIWPNDREE